MRKIKIKRAKVTYRFETEIGEIRVIWEHNGPDTINGKKYATTYEVTIERDRLKGYSVEYQSWITSRRPTEASSKFYTFRFIADIENAKNQAEI